MILNRTAGAICYRGKLCVDWMYTTGRHGMIFELHPQPLAKLSGETIEKDMGHIEKTHRRSLLGDCKYKFIAIMQKMLGYIFNSRWLASFGPAPSAAFART